ncbi:hypothetical protein ACJ41O_006766 [Fusarium nematophilum]
MRDIRDPSAPKTIWVDAVCINQADTKEKSDQVQHMRSVYELADQVLAYLGEEAEDSNLAMAYIRRPCVSISERLETALQRLWSRPYWRRVWVVQELQAAHKEVYKPSDQSTSCFQCGEEVAPISAFGNFVRSWKQSRLVGDELFWTAHSMLILAASVQQQTEPQAIDILKGAAQFEATLPVDKIYALRGLFPAPLRQRLRPEYERNPELQEVLAEFVSAYLDHYHDLNFLCDFYRYVDRLHGDACPTWLPDIYHDLSGMRDWYGTCGMQQTAVARVSQGLLVVEGEIIGRVETTIGPFEHRQAILESTYRNTGRLLSSGASFTSFRHAALKKLRDFQTTPREVQESKFFNLAAGSRVAEQLRPFCPFTCQQLWDAAVSVENGGPLAVFSRIGKSFQFMFARLRNRSYFATNNGHAGLGPSNAREGDVVCVLYGCRLPIMLREDRETGADGQYTFIGPAYVDGAMGGEYSRGMGRRLFRIR